MAKNGPIQHHQNANMQQDTELGHFALHFRPYAAKYNSTHADILNLAKSSTNISQDVFMPQRQFDNNKISQIKINYREN